MALLTTMFGLLGLCAWLFAGWPGVLWSVGLGIGLVLFTRHSSPQLILALYSAKHIPVEMFPDAYDILLDLTHRADIPVVPKLHYIPSAMPTAFSLGKPGNTHIAVSDGLLRLLSVREFAAVLAHEISHIRSRDLTVMALADMVGRMTHFLGMAGLFLLAFSAPGWLATYGFVPWAVGFVMFSAPIVSNLLQLGLSRSREFDADLDAAALTNDPAALASALKKMDWEGRGFLRRLIFGNRESAIPSILRTHPPTPERIARLLSLYKVEEFESVVTKPFEIPVSFQRPHKEPRRRISGLRW